MTESIGQQHRAQTGQRTNLDQRRDERPTDAIDRERDGIGDAELAERHQPGQHRRDRHVQQRADRQRAENADRHVPMRIARLGGGGRHRLETEEGEEQQRGGPRDAFPANVNPPSLGGMYGCQLAGSTACAPASTKPTSTSTLITTSTEFTSADFEMPSARMMPAQRHARGRDQVDAMADAELKADAVHQLAVTSEVDTLAGT